MMRALLFGLRGPQLFNHSEGPMLGAMLPPLVQLNPHPPPENTKKKKKERRALLAEGMPNYV